MADLFTTDGVLLVSEREVCRGDRVHVIQRHLRGIVELAIDVEIDVLQSKGFGPRAAALVIVSCGEPTVFGWSHKPVESHDAEFDDVGVECPVNWMFGVEDSGEHLEHVDGRWVGFGARVVIVFAFLEESRQYGMVPSFSENFEAGILLTQVGDPLAHGQER